MKKILNFLVICLFWFLVYKTSQAILNYVGLNRFISLFFGIFCSLFLISVFYKNATYKKLLIKKTLFFTFFLFVSSLFSYVHYLYYRSVILYDYFSSDSRGWSGRVHKPDSILGFSPIPNSKGFETFPIGEPIPMAYDRDGFRIPLSDSLRTTKEGDADILFLGCSFTYGAACYADSTFAHLVSKEMNFKYINAGVCSYGLSQMYLLTKRLITKYKPKYVVFQYSDWLMKRALSGFAPVHFGSLPTPYYSLKNGVYTLNKPMYETQVFNLDKKEICENYKSKLSFYLRKGFLFFLREDWNSLTNTIGILLKVTSTPSPINEENKLSLTKQVYKEMIKTAKENNCIPLILNLGNDKTLEDEKYFSEYFAGALLADAVMAHNNYLKENKNLSSESFNHWRINNKGDSIVVDRHPNNLSHQLIAKCIIESITKNNLKK